MSVDLYIGCRDCKCAVHTQINARHEVAEGLLDLRWTSEFAAQALPWLREHEDFGPKHEVTQVLAPFCELHAGHTLGIVGDDDVGRWPWRREDAPLPGVGALGAKKKGAREDAARLARFGQDPAALEPLLAALAKDRALSVRVEAARSLASLANTQELRGEALEPVRGALVAALGHEKPELRCGALEALGWLASGCPEDPMVYFEPVCERSADERASVAELLLVALEDAEALEDKPAMEQGLRALTFTRDPRALEAALPLLGDEAPQVRAAAIATLRAATQEGGELGAAAEALAEAAEASVLAAPAGSPRTQAERQWGEILASVGALWPMKELFRRRGWFAQALQQASVGPWQHGRWPLERQAGPQPVVRADLAQPGEELWERPAPLQPHRQPCLSDVDARGDLVAAAGESGVALLYRLSSGERRELVHVPPERRNEELRAVALSPEGALLATGDSKGAVKVWDCASGERVRGFYCGEPVTRLRWFPADEWLLVAGEASLEVRDREGELVQRFPLGHSGAVLEARLDPSGEWLATRGGTHASRGDAAVHVYSLATGQPWTTIEGPCPATGVRWSPCAQRLAILDEKRDLRVYDLASGEVLASLRADYPKQDFALLREGVLLAKKGPTWVGFSGQVERKLDFDGAALAQGPDGQVVFAGGDGSLHVVRGDPSRGAEVRRLAHAQAAQGEPAVAWVGDTIAAVFGSSQPSQVLLLSAGGEERGCLAGERSPKALAISPDEGLLALLCQRQVQVFELASGALLWQREGHFYDPVSLEFDPGGERLIYCDKADSVGGRRPGWVEVRDARSGELRGRHGGRSLVGAVDLSPDGKQVAFGGGLLSSSRDLQANAPCDVLLWDLDECGVVRRLRDEPRRERVLGERCLWVRAVAFSPAGDALATAMQGGLTLWDLERGEPRWRNPAWADSFDFVHLRFSPDGALLYAGREDDVVVAFDAGSGEERALRDRSCDRRHPREAPIAPLADGRLVVARRGIELTDLGAAVARAQREPTPRALDPGRLPETFVAELLGEHESWVQALAWSPDGQRFASGSDDGSVRSFSVEGEELAHLQGLHPPGVSALCFLDSGELVSGGWDGRLRLLSPTGEVLREPIRLDAWVDSLHALPGGRRVLSVSRDQQVVLWDLDRGEAGEPLLASSAGLLSLSPGRELAYGLSRTGGLLQPFVSSSASLGGRGGRPKPALRTFCAETLAPRAALELPEPANGDWRVAALAALADGERVALARGGTVSLLSLASGAEQRLLEQPARVLAAHPSRALLACGDGEGRLRLLDLAGGELEVATHTGGVEALAWSPAGDALLSGGADGEVLRWRL